MNLRKTKPDISDDWKGGITDVCRILGDERPLSSKTVRKYIRLAGVKPQIGTNGRMLLTGKDVKHLWRMI